MKCELTECKDRSKPAAYMVEVKWPAGTSSRWRVCPKCKAFLVKYYKVAYNTRAKVVEL